MFMDKTNEPLPLFEIDRSEKMGLWICALGMLVIGLVGWNYQYILSLC